MIGVFAILRFWYVRGDEDIILLVVKTAWKNSSGKLWKKSSEVQSFPSIFKARTAQVMTPLDRGSKWHSRGDAQNRAFVGSAVCDGTTGSINCGRIRSPDLQFARTSRRSSSRRRAALTQSTHRQAALAGKQENAGFSKWAFLTQTRIDRNNYWTDPCQTLQECSLILWEQKFATDFWISTGNPHKKYSEVGQFGPKTDLSLSTNFKLSLLNFSDE